MALETTNKKHGKKAKESFSNIAYRELKRRILDNEMPAGVPFMEEELAQMLDMSRTPTREAMIRLEKEGLVEIRPRHGMSVKQVSVEDMREIYSVLTALESTAAGIAAERKPSEEELAPLRQAVEDMDIALDADDLDTWARADESFHFYLVELSKNRRIIELVQNFMDQSHRARMLTLRIRPKPVESNIAHREVLEAITKGRADTARRKHRQHREVSGVMLASLLEKFGL